ncbi:hypothetical protein BEWA_016660 [Theileria equi strain WA]|uniref:Uncharacterized protein n=1 Tax=Theileria equi strain WA TaxID=1537102 RepID=L1L9Z8_THEEQ|nr:hypothetical protein BEWA_016660 [Theileria equi strain WA]EKX71988.1 hypothetical protein BEWA_016660 [Theileria equi strain WA]|eukprot:XP_004831440.1 hypothetical protein BEWA_016660 [Theileria equi strain WA]
MEEEERLVLLRERMNLQKEISEIREELRKAEVAAETIMRHNDLYRQAVAGKVCNLSEVPGGLLDYFVSGVHPVFEKKTDSPFVQDLSKDICYTFYQKYKNSKEAQNTERVVDVTDGAAAESQSAKGPFNEFRGMFDAALESPSSYTCTDDEIPFFEEEDLEQYGEDDEEDL